MKIIVVDEKDNMIGLAERNDFKFIGITRVSSLWLTNSKGEILLARRSFMKNRYPGLWGPAVAGSLEEGETYESNIIKEIQQEIGVDNLNPQKFKKIFYEVPPFKRFCTFFIANCDMLEKDFILDKEEVIEVKWISAEDLVNWFLKSPSDFILSFEFILKTFNLLK